MHKVLSIIIPTFNMERYLRRCLDSLIIDEESMKLLEVLVVNDGSKDSSSQIAHEYQHKYPNTFIVIDKENGNYGSCINRGLKDATGKYVKVLDADDWFDNTNFANFLDDISSIDVNLILSDYCIVNENKRIVSQSCFRIDNGKILSFRKVYKKLMGLQMHQVAYKTECLRRINYHQTEGISYTDQEWIFHPMTTVTTIYYHNKTIYYYLLGREGQTMDSNVLLKNMSHTVLGTKNMIALYKTFHHLSYYHKQYLCERLDNRLSYLYTTYNNPDNRLNPVDFDEINAYFIQHIFFKWTKVKAISSFRLYKSKFRNIFRQYV